jgi:hypothetical protein
MFPEVDDRRMSYFMNNIEIYHPNELIRRVTSPERQEFKNKYEAINIKIRNTLKKKGRLIAGRFHFKPGRLRRCFSPSTFQRR